MTATRYVTTPELAARGWTPAMIRNLLGTADRRQPNPRYRRASPMQLYDIRRVEQAEAGPEFTAARTKAARRSETARQAAHRRRTKTMTAVEQLAITVPVMGRKELIERACDAYNRWEGGLFDEPAGPDSDPAFIERITVNHIRHDLAEYDQTLADQYRLLGGDTAKARIRERVYEATAHAYPYLAEECRRQQHRHVDNHT
ncbi:hypothetical protein ABIE67_009750 [Streptomyces sp. V4I8]|uniref:hypothetical protein n=1 Tax=Streptomyces sp. V4I8 TaxID=3156469 RepID=UPI003517DED7